VLEGRVDIGARARIGHGTILGGQPQDLKFKDGTPSGVRIGADTAIREYVTVHRATRAEEWTEIGAGCLIMVMSHVAHDCRLGDGVIVVNYAGITGHCTIGDHATIGGLVGVLADLGPDGEAVDRDVERLRRVLREDQLVRGLRAEQFGEALARQADRTRRAYAYIGGCSKVVADVPPFVLADGNPAGAHAINVVGLRRAGMKPADRRLLQEAYRLLYRSGLATPRAVERIRQELPAAGPVVQLLEFIAGSRRGICGPAQPGTSAADAVPSPESEPV